MITLYGRSTPFCPKCEQAKNFLNSKDIEFEYIDLSNDPDKMGVLVGREIPQAFSENGEYIGGLKDVLKWIQS